MSQQNEGQAWNKSENDKVSWVDKQETEAKQHLNELEAKVFNLSAEELLEFHEAQGPIQLSEELLKNLKADNKNINDLVEVQANFIKDITEIKPENKLWILQSLGFKQEGKAKWSHPFLKFDYHLESAKAIVNFDIHTDDIKLLVNKIYNMGWRDAKNDIW